MSEGITNPPIDDLLAKVGSKYELVLYSAKRARQINAYYSQLGEGLLEHVGPLVETGIQEKPLTTALREINADVLEAHEIDPEAEAAAAAAAQSDPDFSDDLGDLSAADLSVDDLGDLTGDVSGSESNDDGSDAS